ncbi:MAG TPA: hypothetical protein DEG09_01820 [Marinilabiliaceae bacterium]|jgi:two-component SAPR family response regulator|nr:hypothetical protein [Marinilabiliaceae bacterium]
MRNRAIKQMNIMTVPVVFIDDNYTQKLTGVETALYIRQYNTACNIVFVTSSDLQLKFKAVVQLKILHKPADKVEIFRVMDEILSSTKKDAFGRF